MTLASPLLTTIFRISLLLTATYLAFLTLLSIPSFQTHAIYLHKLPLTWWSHDTSQPTQCGFLPGQVTPFYLHTPDNESLHAWHVLPVGLYQQHQAELIAEPTGSDSASDISQGLALKLLRDDPRSLLVIYLHGAAGTLGSGWRPASYRAMHALAPTRIHTIAIDYRGFGKSTGSPSEDGLLIDAHALLRWAMEEAKIPADRIVVFAQSLGTAVALSLAHDLAVKSPESVHLKGIVLVAPFADVAELTSTYSIAGTVPLLGPVARFLPGLFAFFKGFLVCRWPSREYLANLIGAIERTKGASFDVSILHAKDDWDIPWSHSEALFWDAVSANLGDGGKDFEEVKEAIVRSKKALGEGGWSLEWRTDSGVLRQEIVEYGLHDRIMSYPLVSRAVWRAFRGDEEVQDSS